MNCREFEEDLPLFLYEELSGEQKAACEAHAAACEACRASLAETRHLHDVLAERPSREPSTEFLMECRQSLDEALDREQHGWGGLFRAWVAALRLRPASGFAGALALLVFGFGLGWGLRPRMANVAPAPTTNSASLTGTGEDLQDARIKGISRVAPDPKTGDVRITLDAERRVTIEGALDNDRIQSVLVYALKSYNNPGIRRDTLDALRAGAGQPKIRRALLYAMQNDPNVGVRLEALDAVRGLDWGPDLQQAFLDTVQHDKNDGVRVAAVDVLARHADRALTPALERLATSDACPYVRMKCTNAVRQLAKTGDDLSTGNQ